jgi:hypothetical protein
LISWIQLGPVDGLAARVGIAGRNEAGREGNIAVSTPLSGVGKGQGGAGAARPALLAQPARLAPPILVIVAALKAHEAVLHRCNHNSPRALTCSFGTGPAHHEFFAHCRISAKYLPLTQMSQSCWISGRPANYRNVRICRGSEAEDAAGWHEPERTELSDSFRYRL